MNVKLEFIEGGDLYQRVMLDMVLGARRNVWIATANVKDCQVELEGEFRSIAEAFAMLCRRGVEVRLLHAGVPSASFLESMKAARLAAEPNFKMRRCPRVHFKAVLVDDRQLHVGSANLTGAGLGAKSAKRRNFEVGILTSDAGMLEQVARLFHEIWEGRHCPDCGRRDVCQAPLDGASGPR